jgi:GTP-binding protein
VSIDVERSFVIADVPGLIEGAAEGAGLGVQFLKHLQRTRLLLHLVDLAPPDESEDPVCSVRLLESEMARFDPELLEKPRWLVFNKADLLPPGEAEAQARDTVEQLAWPGPWCVVSAATQAGTRELMQKVMSELELLAAAPEPGATGGR